MTHLKDRTDFIDQLDDNLNAFLARRFPHVHRIARWYTDERLAKIKPRNMYIGLVFTALLLIISYWRT